MGYSYIKSYKAYKTAVKNALSIRLHLEKEQQNLLKRQSIKILLAGHPYNLYDALVGLPVTKFLKENNIDIFYIDRLPHKLIDK